MNIEERFIKSQELFNEKFNNGIKNNNVDNQNEYSFGGMLKNCINDVNNSEIESDNATNAFIKGEDVSIEDVILKRQEALMNLQFLTQTRDKLLEGYNELSKMQL